MQPSASSKVVFLLPWLAVLSPIGQVRWLSIIAEHGSLVRSNPLRDHHVRSKLEHRYDDVYAVVTPIVMS
jgi:hypothetical protein